MIPVKFSKTPWYYKIPYYTLAMFVIYISLFYGLPESRTSSLILNMSYSQQVYRWYTYSLIHFNTIHLAVNMFNFLVFGSLVEFDQYTLRTIGINIIAILGGAFGVGWQVRTTKQNLNVMGASGGVYGLLSSQISNLALNWKDLGNVQKWAYVITLTSTITTDIVVNIIYYNPQISYSNHIGGFLFGILGGLCIMKNITEIPWEKKMIIIAGSLLGVCSLVSAINLGMVHQVVEAS